MCRQLLQSNTAASPQRTLGAMSLRRTASVKNKQKARLAAGFLLLVCFRHHRWLRARRHFTTSCFASLVGVVTWAAFAAVATIARVTVTLVAVTTASAFTAVVADATAVV